MVEKKDLKNDIQKISGVVSYSLRISRVPAKTFEKFVKLAKEEFADDYGMTLKYLLDFKETTEKWLELVKKELEIKEKEMGGKDEKKEEGH